MIVKHDLIDQQDALGRQYHAQSDRVQRDTPLKSDTKIGSSTETSNHAGLNFTLGSDWRKPKQPAQHQWKEASTSGGTTTTNHHQPPPTNHQQPPTTTTK